MHKVSPPQRAAVPTAANRGALRDRDDIRPLASTGEPIPLTARVPDGSQANLPPEIRDFVEAYRSIGQPRIVIVVNRALTGELIPPNPASRSPAGGDTSGQLLPVLLPNQFDEAAARSIDYPVIEAAMFDSFGVHGQVMVVPPLQVAARLSSAQIQAIQSGQNQVLADLGRQLDADVLVQIQPRAVSKSAGGIRIRLLAQVMNVRGGELLAQEFVEIEPPLDRDRLDSSTGLLARKLMHGARQSWKAVMAGEPRGDPPASAPSRSALPRAPQSVPTTRPARDSSL